MIERRNIAVCIVLTPVTCGIYGIYWIVCLTNDVNTVSGDVNGTSGGMVVLLTIVTCGIYGIYWMLKLNDEINLLCGDTNAASGALVVIFSLITCGIYGFYWMYKMGEKCDFIKGVQGSSGILYLLLGIFGLSIVDFCLIQDTINKSV